MAFSYISLRKSRSFKVGVLGFTARYAAGYAVESLKREIGRLVFDYESDYSNTFNSAFPLPMHRIAISKSKPNPSKPQPDNEQKGSGGYERVKKIYTRYAGFVGAFAGTTAIIDYVRKWTKELEELKERNAAAEAHHSNHFIDMLHALDFY